MSALCRRCRYHFPAARYVMLWTNWLVEFGLRNEMKKNTQTKERFESSVSEAVNKKTAAINRMTEIIEKHFAGSGMPPAGHSSASSHLPGSQNRLRATAPPRPYAVSRTSRHSWHCSMTMNVSPSSSRDTSIDMIRN